MPGVLLGRVSALSLLLGICTGPSISKAAELTLQPADGGVIEAQINGQPVRLRVDFDAPSFVTLNKAAAKRIGLKAAPFKAKGVIGPVTFLGNIGKAKLTVAGATSKPLVIWFERDYAPDVDGLIGPAGLPYDVVRFVRHAPRAGEHKIIVPVTLNAPKAKRQITAMPPSLQGLLVQFSVSRPSTVANASGGALIARLGDGRDTGEPTTRYIAFGVSRPVQPVKLRSPISLSGLKVDRVEVRTTGPVAPAASGSPGDVEEVIVTAKKRGGSAPLLKIGQDVLNACSSVTYTKATATLTMTCTD